MVTMRCAQRDIFLSEFDMAARRFREACAAWDRHDESGVNFAAASRAREEARIDCELARLSLEKHTEDHRCGMAN